MDRRLLRFFAVLFLLPGVVATTPFFSMIAIPAHGTHSVRVSPGGGEINLRHEQSEHVRDARSSTGHTHRNHEVPDEHDAKVTFGTPTVRAQLSIVAPEQKIVFPLLVASLAPSEKLNLCSNSIFRVLREHNGKSSAPQLDNQTTVLLL